MAIDDNASYELTGYQVKDLASKIRAKADSNSLASVATSGLYSDLTGAPTIPTVYNGTLTIQQNGTQLGTFSANQSSNTTINITGGGGSSVTTFYGTFNTAYQPESGLGSHLYSDSSLTTMVTSQDVYDAVTSGTAIIEVYYADYPYFIVITSARVWEEDSVGYEFGCESIANGYGEGPFIYVLSASAASTTFSETHLRLQPKLTAGTNVTITSNTISATDTTYSDFTGATTLQAGTAGLVPAPTTSDPDKFLKGDGTWGTPASGGPTTNLYWDVATFNFYKDNALGQLMTPSAIFDAFEAGHTVFEDGTQTYTIVHVFPSAKTITAVSSAYTGTSSYGYLLIFTYDDNSSEWTLRNNDIINRQMTGATASVAGTSGIVPAPAAGDQGKALLGDGTWGDPTAKLVEMSYGESNAWAKFLAAYQAKSIVYCGASSNANPGSGAKTRRAFMAYVNNETTPTEVEFQYVRSVGTKTSSQPVDQVFVYKLTSANGGTWSVATRDMAPKLAAGTNTSVSYSSGTYTVSASIPGLDYSTSEVDTGTTWVDGKTIYKKTVDFGALPNATTKTVAHGISNLYRVIKYECIAYNSGSSSNTPVPLVSAVGNNSTIDINATNIVMSAGVDRSAFDECYVTLYYTKSS